MQSLDSNMAWIAHSLAWQLRDQRPRWGSCRSSLVLWPGCWWTIPRAELALSLALLCRAVKATSPLCVLSGSRFCQPVALWRPPVSQGLPFNMLLVPNNCRRSFLCMEFFFLERETLVCFSTYLCTQGLISFCAPTRYWTPDLGIQAQLSNQLSYPARATMW